MRHSIIANGKMTPIISLKGFRITILRPSFHPSEIAKLSAIMTRRSNFLFLRAFGAEKRAHFSESALAPSEQFLDILELQLDIGRAAMVALAGMGGGLHLAQQSVHLIGGKATA